MTIAYISLGILGLFLVLMIIMIVVSVLLLKKLKSNPSSLLPPMDNNIVQLSLMGEEKKTERSKSKSVRMLPSSTESVHLPTPKKIITKSEKRKSRFSNVLDKL